MADYKITMNNSLDDVTSEQLTNLCKFLQGSFAGAEGNVFILKGSAKEPKLNDVNHAFGQQAITTLSCIAVKQV